MDKKSIFTEQEENFLINLRKSGVEFIIVGLSAATLQGAPVVTQDVDLWFKNLQDPNIAKVARKLGGSYIPTINLNPPMFAGKGLGLFDIVMTLHGLNKFEEEVTNTIKLKIRDQEILVLKLERIIKSKEAANREKDKLVLPVLRDSLIVIKERSREN